MSHFSRRIGRINELLYFFAGTVSPYDTSEFLDVVAAQCKHWLPGLFVELRRSEIIGGLCDVVKLMLYQCAELKVTAL
ncbi:Uncharacterised protein [Enterobacter kobei]|nr:Uncharacterised protein [Enterobacter kobei]